MITVDGCNCCAKILAAYYPLSANGKQPPVYVDLDVRIGNMVSSCSLPIKEFNAKGIEKKCPLIRFQGKQARPNFDNALVDELTNGLADGSIQSGYYLEKSGAIVFPDGHIGFLRGAELLGICNRPYKVAPEISDMELAGEGSILTHLLSLLITSPLQVLLVFAYVILSSIRSLLVSNGIDLQAVLYIVGGQGLGKTTLATRIAGIYKKDGRTAGIVQAGSTHAAVNTLMTTLRDQPLVVDDLCLSASRDTTRKRIELVSKLLRQATGSIPIIKKSGTTTVELPSEASLILTAEYSLENMSDLTRCITVPIQYPIDIPDELTTDLIGDAVRHYSLWFTEHIQDELKQFRRAVDIAVSKSDTDARIATNYACLMTAFQSFIRSLTDLEYPQEMVAHAHNMMDMAISKAKERHSAMIEQIKDSIPVGNLSLCILEGYRHDAFDLTKNVKKLCEHDGIIWKSDLCIKPEALIQFIRQQPGYHDWSSNRITRELKDIKALVLQEENAATVRLSKEPGVSRVYRIRKEILKETARKYEGGVFNGM